MHALSMLGSRCCSTEFLHIHIKEPKAAKSKFTVFLGQVHWSWLNKAQTSLQLPSPLSSPTDCCWSQTVSVAADESAHHQWGHAELYSLGSCARALIVLWGRRRGGGIEERSLYVVGAAGLPGVNGRGSLIEGSVPPFRRNAAAALLLWESFLNRVHRLAALHHSVCVRVLDLKAGETQKHQESWGSWSTLPWYWLDFLPRVCQAAAPVEWPVV